MSQIGFFNGSGGGGGGSVTSVNTNSGTATPVAGVLNVVGTVPIQTSGSGDTVTIALTSDVPVADGGTGVSSFTAYSVITGGTTSTGPLQNVSGIGTSGQVLTSNGAGMLPTWQTNSPGTGIVTLDADTGAATGAVVTVVGGNNIVTTAAGSNFTIDVNGTTDHSVQVGNASGSLTSLSVGTTGQVLIGSTAADPAFGALGVNSGLTTHGVLVGEGNSAIVSVSPSATSGIPLISQGVSADPIFGTAVVAGGGTGNTTFTAFSVVAAGTTATGSFQNVSGVGTSGQVLTSNGAATLPTWQNTAASSISITGDTGGALTGNSFTFAGGTTGLSFNGAVSTQTLTFAGITANGGTVSLATDATASTINIGTGAGVKTTTVGSTNTTSPTTVQSGSGALNITSTNGAITMNSGTGTIGIGTDATAATYNFSTGAGAKSVTLGTTNTTSSLALKYGTSDFTLASATGTVMSALDTGEITYPLQPAFLGSLQSFDADVTGNGAQYTLGTNIALTEIFDQNGDFNTNGTFTAPVTGKYVLKSSIIIIGCTIATGASIRIMTSNRTYFYRNQRAAGNQQFGVNSTALADMDIGDVATIIIQADGEAANTDDLSGAAIGAGEDCWFSGYLAC